MLVKRAWLWLSAARPGPAAEEPQGAPNGQVKGAGALATLLGPIPTIVSPGVKYKDGHGMCYISASLNHLDFLGRHSHFLKPRGLIWPNKKTDVGYGVSVRVSLE